MKYLSILAVVMLPAAAFAQLDGSSVKACVPRTSTRYITKTHPSASAATEATSATVVSAPVASVTDAASATSAPAAAAATPIAKYYQCDGLNFVKSGDCVEGTTCTHQNDFYWQCL